jgi:2-polyprenyl-3-methyl-5-hydroxy-6-metoxy-1,4-benzoquinol methylase
VDATFWDQRYGGSEFVWTTEPNRFLAEVAEQLEPGRALDLACGEGRNAVWLAEQGWDVTGVDFSQVGLDKAAVLADVNGVTCTWLQADLSDWEPDTQWDFVFVCYLQVHDALRRQAIGAAARAVAPGGTLFVVGHDRRNLTDGVGGPQDPSVLYTSADLEDDVAASGADALVVTRAEVVYRSVVTEGGERSAVDCVLRAERGE